MKRAVEESADKFMNAWLRRNALTTEEVVFLTYAQAAVEQVELIRQLDEMRYGVFAGVLL